MTDASTVCLTILLPFLALHARPPAPCTPYPCSGPVLVEAQGRTGRQKAVDLEDMKFHQCVRLASFERDRTISFIPPDGAFDLM